MTTEQSPLEQYKSKKIAECKRELCGDKIGLETVWKIEAFLSQTIDELEEMHDEEMTIMFRESFQ